MADNNRSNPPQRGGGDGNRAPGGRGSGGPGGRGRNDGRRNDPRRGGFGKDSSPARAETYESVKEVMRGPDYRIDKSVVAEKGTHKPVKTEYRLTREGLRGPEIFTRLAEAQNAATAPLPEPAELAAEPAEETETAVAAGDAPPPTPES